jgi:nibrin
VAGDPGIGQLSEGFGPELDPARIAPPKRIGRSRRAVTSRFKGFDDDFDTTTLENNKEPELAQVEFLETQESGLFVSQTREMEFNSPPLLAAAHSQPNRKRPLSPMIGEGEEDIMEELAPTAANLKRRRLAEEAAWRRKYGSTLPELTAVEKKLEPPKTKSKKSRPEIDILEVARQKREREEAIAKAEREALQTAMDGMDIEQIRNLAVVEEIEIKRTAPAPCLHAHGDESGRWNERWNGRKNFKKFHRRGEGSQRPVNKVIVPLEEVKKKDFGIGDEYWLGGGEDDQRRKKGRGRLRRDQLISQTQSQPAATQTQVDIEPTLEEVGTMDLHGISRRAMRPRNFSDKTLTSQNYQSPSKRTAEPLTRQAPAKRAKQSARIEDSDDSDDGLGFRFRRR